MVRVHWVRGVVAGLVGGLVAAGAMSLAHTAVGALAPAPASPLTPGEEEEDATVKVASAVSRLFGRPLVDEDKPRAGTLVHYGFGALVGAGYGFVAEFLPIVTRAVGIPFGAAVWLGAHVIAVPALGLAEPPTRRPLRNEAEEFALHLVYGAATELIRRLARR
jgi:putative membrane protein